MRTNKTRYIVLSPDGFAIHPTRSHGTPKLAEGAFHKWKKNFEKQGYYSTIQGGKRVQIPLDELENHCSIVPLKRTR